MAGAQVDRQMLDMKMAQTIRNVRGAFRDVEAVFDFLATVPKASDGTDPLTASTEPIDPMDSTTAPGRFGYTEDEAYLIRFLFESLQNINIKPLLKQGRKLTGLE